MSDAQWHYSGEGWQPAGPVTPADLRDLAAQGAVTPDTLVWRDGMAAWAELREVAELQDVLDAAAARASPPPALPQASRNGIPAFQLPRPRTQAGGRGSWAVLALCLAGMAILAAVRVREHYAARAVLPDTAGPTPAWQLRLAAGGRHPERLPLPERMAIQDLYVDWAEARMPAVAQRLWENRGDAKRASVCCDELNRITAADPFNQLKFPCGNALSAAARKGEYAAYLAWFDRYRKRQEALGRRVAAIVKNGPAAGRR